MGGRHRPLGIGRGRRGVRHLLLDLDAPLMSFGGDMVDAYGVVRDFPAKSMVAGLLANALGWERYEAVAHARLQERLVIGSARVAEGRRVRDFQTARLGEADQGWTTRGRVEGRKKSPSYDSDQQELRRSGTRVKVITHIRYRDADADARMLVALRLEPAEEAPDLDVVTAALDRPERPLFVGRKPFLPSRPLRLGTVEADGVPAALAAGLLLLDKVERLPDVRAQWPLREAADAALLATTPQEEELTDERHWPAGVHAGLRRVMEGRVLWPAPAEAEAAA
jgi:CRISPR system Cascade subunit CasD